MHFHSPSASTMPTTLRRSADLYAPSQCAGPYGLARLVQLPHSSRRACDDAWALDAREPCATNADSFKKIFRLRYHLREENTPATMTGVGHNTDLRDRQRSVEDAVSEVEHTLLVVNGLLNLRKRAQMPSIKPIHVDGFS
jgi:hypothetical protein